MKKEKKKKNLTHNVLARILHTGTSLGAAPEIAQLAFGCALHAQVRVTQSGVCCAVYNAHLWFLLFVGERERECVCERDNTVWRLLRSLLCPPVVFVVRG